MSALSESPSLTFSPLYKQVVGLLVRGLESGEWKPDVALPSEADLALRFGVSQGTVRKALDELVGENLLIRRQGKGTFVATHGDPEAFSRFLCLAPDEGELSPFKNIPLACWRAKAGPEVARHLSVEPGAPVIIVRRLLGLTQQQLAVLVGIRFQQIQKYECGANRISAARLWQLAEALETTVAYFYDGLAEAMEADAPTPKGGEVFSRKETLDLIQAYYQLGERPRRRLLDLAKSLHTESDAA